MKKLLLTTAFFCILPLFSALADGGFYLGLHGGASLPEGVENEGISGTFNLESDPGYVAGATLGYDLRENYPAIGVGRLEIEASYRNADLDEAEFAEGGMEIEGETTVFSVMLNTFGEHRGTAPWIPYVGAGIGWARVSLEEVEIFGGTLVDDEDHGFAFQLGAGFGYELGSNFAFDLGYRYFMVPEVDFTDSGGEGFESEYRTHQVQLGMRMTF